MDVEEGTSNGDGTESSEALQCLKGAKVNNGNREIVVKEGKGNDGAADFSKALQCLKGDEINNEIGEIGNQEGKSSDGATESSEALQYLKSDKGNDGLREMDVEEGKGNGGVIESCEALRCLKNNEVNHGTMEMDVEEGKSNCGGTELSEAKNDEVSIGANEMDVEEGKSNDGSTAFSEALHCFKSDEVNNRVRKMDVEEGKGDDGSTEFYEVLPCLKDDEVNNEIRFRVEANVAGPSSGLKSDEVNDGIRFGMEADVAGSSSSLKSDEVSNEIRFGMQADIEGSSLGMKRDEVNNGAVFGVRANVAGWSSRQNECFLTYRRRKRVKSSHESILEDDKRAYAKGVSQLGHQHLKDQQGEVSDNNSCEQIHLPKESLDGCSQGPWKIVLEHMYQSLSDDEGGIQRSIRDALEAYPGIGSTKRTNEFGHHDESRGRCPSPTQHLLNGFEKEASRHPDVLSNGNLDILSHDTATDMCRHVCFDILISEKFTSLCKLLFDNFQGIKIDNFFDLNLINSRMKDGIYDESPVLFLKDIQQVWEKLQGVGAEMISLAKSLSDISRSCYNKQFCTSESDSHTKLEKGEDCSAYKACTCRQCGLEADGRDCLVCDSCEEMYHVSCIEPAVEEIPPKSWYCATCVANGIRSPHENCVVCERLNAPRTAVKFGNDSSYTNEETFNELGENSDWGTDEEGSQPSKRSINLGQCKICGSELQDGEKLKICSNIGCGGYFHARCLTKKQLNSYGPGWYCPSCLCRTCLIDKDDDKIVLCDGCDHAYHIYCMKPERTSIPKGKWFCGSCNAKLEAIRKAKKAFEKRENKQKRKNNKGLGTFDKGGGAMDMLISAADTLNNQEKWAGILAQNSRK